MNKVDERMLEFNVEYNIEKHNVDTVCAIANIREYKHVIKDHIRNEKIANKFYAAIKMVKKVYPDANINVIKKELWKIGVIPKWIIVVSIILIYLITPSILAHILNYQHTWQYGMTYFVAVVIFVINAGIMDL